MLVHNEPVGRRALATPPHSILMLDILGWRQQNLKYNKHLYFKHVVPLILSIYNPVLIIGLHFHPLSQVLFYHNNTHEGFTVNIVPTDKIFLLKQLSFKYSYLHATGSRNNKLLFNLVINLCIIPDSTDTWKFHTYAVIKEVYLNSITENLRYKLKMRTCSRNTENRTVVVVVVVLVVAVAAK
jgi:hypothetical protein